jgi:hypothetical protein
MTIPPEEAPASGSPANVKGRRVLAAGAATLLALGLAFLGVRVSTTTGAGPRDLEKSRMLKGFTTGTPIANGRKERNVWLAVLTKDVQSMTDDTFDFLMDWNCQRNAKVHLVVSSLLDAQSITNRRRHALTENECAPFHVMVEPGHLTYKLHNRIDRIAHLRDLQRHTIQELVTQEDEDSNRIVDAIIVLDGDLHSLPNAALVEHEMEHHLFGIEQGFGGNGISKPSGMFDVLCATGVNHNGKDATLASHYGTDRDGLGYYDTFATILKPNTWLYPLISRLNSEHYLFDEDPRLVMKEDDTIDPVAANTESGMTGPGILKYIQEQAGASPFPVQSCFGGMAIYNGRVWLDTISDEAQEGGVACQYSSEVAGDPGRYANQDDERTCEHITFHQCLQGRRGGLHIALHPHLVTEYHDMQSVFEVLTLPQFRQLQEDCECVFQMFLRTDQNPGEVSIGL